MLATFCGFLCVKLNYRRENARCSVLFGNVVVDTHKKPQNVANIVTLHICILPMHFLLNILLLFVLTLNDLEQSFDVYKTINVY